MSHRNDDPLAPRAPSFSSGIIGDLPEIPSGFPSLRPGSTIPGGHDVVDWSDSDDDGLDDDDEPIPKIFIPPYRA